MENFGDSGHSGAADTNKVQSLDASRPHVVNVPQEKSFRQGK
jgi:hypothetical protein